MVETIMTPTDTQGSNNKCPNKGYLSHDISIPAQQGKIQLLLDKAMKDATVKAFIELGPGHRHDALYGVAKSTKILCDSEDTLSELLIKIYVKAAEKSGGEVDEDDCQNTAKHAWCDDGNKAALRKKASGRKAKKVNKVALYAKLQEEALPGIATWAMSSEAERLELSPCPSSDDTPASVIRAIMQPCLMENEYIWCSESLTSAKDSRAFYKADCLASILPNALFFVPNPLASQSRTDDAVTRIMFCPIECDSELEPVDSPKMSEQWMDKCKMQQQKYFGRLAARLPFALVTYSGCKSLHGLVAVDASMDEWDASRPTLIGLYTALGLDIAMLNPSRCTRAPQGTRYFNENNGTWVNPNHGKCSPPAVEKLERIQEVLYINPDAERWSLKQYIEALKAIAVEMHGEEWIDQTLETVRLAEAGQLTQDSTEGDNDYAREKPWTTTLNANSIQAMLDFKCWKLWYNTTTNMTVLESTDGMRLTDDDEIMSKLHTEYTELYQAKNVPLQVLRLHVGVIAQHNRRSEVNEWLKKLKWDGISRLTVIYRILGLTDELSQTLVHKWLLQTAAMSENAPDNWIKPAGVLVLQGAEGIGKTGFFRHLIPLEKQATWFYEGKGINAETKDDIIQLQKGWIIELGELDSTMTREQAKLKAIITSGRVDVRAPYAASVKTTYTQTSLCATVNPQEYLRGNNGDRRWWTIHVDRIDFDMLNALNIEQLWAEIQHEWDNADKHAYCAVYDLSFDELNALTMRNKDNYHAATGYDDMIHAAFDFDMPKDEWIWIAATEAANIVVNYSNIGNSLQANPKDIVNIGKTFSAMGIEKKKKHGGINSYLLPKRRK